MTNMISLSYTDLLYQSQGYASSSVGINSDVGSKWVGDVTISPLYNNWIGDNSNIVSQKNDSNYIEWSVNTKIKPIYLTRNIWTSIYNTSNNSNLLSYIDETYLIVTCSNFKPNTMVYGFIDGKPYSDKQYNVNEYNTIVNNDPVVTDSNGHVKFIIVIPKNELSHDIKELVICDDALKRDAFITTIGVTYLLYNNNLQPLYTKTKSTMLANNSIAQSFSINNIDGLFISKIGIYFKSKPNIYVLQYMSPDNSDPAFGCTVELRQVINGYPEDKAIAKSHIKYNDINVSQTGTMESIVTFDDPVYLQYQSEYCFVITPDANLNGFDLWCSVINQNDVLTNYKITTQPASGVLYKSSNNTAWTPYQDYDLKYNLYRTRFSNSGEVILTNDDSDYFIISNISGNFVAGEKVYGDVIITIIEQHGSTFTYIVGDEITFNNGAVGTIKAIGNRVITLTFNDYSTLPVVGSSFTDPSNSDWNVTDIQIAEGIVFYKNYPFLTIKDSTGYFSETQVITGLYSETTATIDSIYDKSFSIVYPSSQEFIPSNTYIKRYIKSVRSGTLTDYIEVDNLKNNEFNYVMQVYSKSNEMANLNGDKSFYYKLELSSDTTWLSPILNTNYLECKIIYNQINYPSTVLESTDSNSNCLFRYITKTFTLNDNQDAEDLLVYITAKRPVSTDIKIYYKIMHAEDDVAFNNHTWVEMESSNSRSNEFIEYKYVVSDSNKNNGIITYTVDGAVYFGYKYFSIKVVGLSANAALYPVIQNLQIIALQK